MKRLLLVALMIQVTLIGFSSAADDVMRPTVTRVIGNTHRSLDAISHDQINVDGGLQAEANPTTGVSLDAISHDQINVGPYYSDIDGSIPSRNDR
jgi:hypothetical protein